MYWNAQRPAILTNFTSTWHRLAGLRLLEQFQLSRRAFPCTTQIGQAQRPKDALDRAHGEPDLMHPQKPQPRPGGPVAQRLARVADVPEDLRAQLGRPLPG